MKRSTQTYTASIAKIVELMQRGNSPHLPQLAVLLNKLSVQTAAVGAMNDNPSPTLTPAANFKKVQEAAKRLDDARKATVAAASEIVGKGIRDIQAKIDAKVKLIPSDHAREIREVFRLTPIGERPKFLNDLAILNKGPELAAIIAVPAILTGITDEMQSQFRRLILETHAGSELAEQTELTEAMTEVLAATDVAQAFVTDIADPTRLADIEAREAAATAAEAALNSAIAAE